MPDQMRSRLERVRHEARFVAARAEGRFEDPGVVVDLARERQRKTLDARRCMANVIAADFSGIQLDVIERADVAELTRWCCRLQVALVGLLTAERLYPL